ncbi:MAG: outer membrane protein assembly factor BamE [Pseudomonadaceae bacterium]|nr:outer membrane protein assembly factor BamE [Pseudomonadaceae bacterium]
MPTARTSTPITVVIAAIAASLLVVGCMPKIKIPSVHRITVQQGNVITQEMIDRLKPGMTRSQVIFVMGEPVFRNTFNDKRWDYIYTIEIGDQFSDDKRVSVYFEDDLLAYFTGDFAPSSADEAEDSGETDAQSTPASDDTASTDPAGAVNS